MTKIAAISLLALSLATSLSGCATFGGSETAMTPAPVLPISQYALTADQTVEPINLRINSNGLSENQRRALDQLAARAAWTTGAPVEVEIITAGEPRAVNAGHAIGSYLSVRDVSADTISQISAPGQPGDIVTINLVSYQAHTYACNQTWQNLAATRNNRVPSNFGCAVTSNLAAQVADPRDLATPQAATPTDVMRRATVLEHYRKGEATSAAQEQAAKGTVSSAIN